MATLYPTPLPRKVRDDPMRAAERRVYEALGDGLGPSHSVFYGVAWLARDPRGRARDGEADFVVAHPEHGLLLLEVKGGAICRDGATGRWTSIDRAGYPHPIHDPFAQARTSKHALLEKLKELPALGGAWVPMGHGVVLPDCASPHAPLAPDAPPAITVFQDDMPRLGARVDGMFRYWDSHGPGAPRPAPGFVAAVTALLAPTFELRQPLGPALRDEDRELLRLTEQQFNVLDLLARQRRVSITGGAGTGKTVLALEKARRLAAEGFRVLLTCFNKPLADYLAGSAGTTDGLTVMNFHRLCWEFARRAGIPLLDPAADTPPPPDYFSTTLPAALAEALTRLPERFDAIAVDEGQDFLESWWEPLQRLEGPAPSGSGGDHAGGILYVFHDDNQQVYRRTPSFPSGLVEITLHDNLRNTRRIHAATAKFYRGEPLCPRGPEGRPVELVEVSAAEDVSRAVGAVLDRLIRAEHVEPRDIAVLLGSSRQPLGKGARIGRYDTTMNQAAEPGKVLVESVRRFKGLERSVVVLTGIDDLAPEQETALLYVGLSRARVHLVVVATAATLARLR